MIEPAALYREIEALIATVRREGDAQAATWSDRIVRAGFQESASNLAHYLALRHRLGMPPCGVVRNAASDIAVVDFI